MLLCYVVCCVKGNRRSSSIYSMSDVKKMSEHMNSILNSAFNSLKSIYFLKASVQ